MNDSMVILVAGPATSGTNGDPVAEAANLRRMERTVRILIDAGHLPVIAHRMGTTWDAVFRLPGQSREADRDAAAARAQGLPVFTSVDDVPRTERKRESITSPTRGPGAASNRVARSVTFGML